MIFFSSAINIQNGLGIIVIKLKVHYKASKTSNASLAAPITIPFQNMSEKLLIEVFQAHKTENYGSKTFVPEIMGPASLLTKIEREYALQALSGWTARPHGCSLSHCRPVPIYRGTIIHLT